MTNPKDDLGAVRLVVEALEGFPAEDQERIIRWAREKVGLAIVSPILPVAPPVPVLNPVVPPAGSKDLKTFIAEKKPKNDVQFAATVAYYYRFEAPPTLRKHEINGDDLQEGCRLVGRERFTRPGQTLRNAHTLGLLDKGSQSGSFTVNSVGENLVAVALTGDGTVPVNKKKKKKGTRGSKRSPKK
jgi:hypothetical protein